MMVTSRVTKRILLPEKESSVIRFGGIYFGPFKHVPKKIGCPCGEKHFSIENLGSKDHRN